MREVGIRYSRSRGADDPGYERSPLAGRMRPRGFGIRGLQGLTTLAMKDRPSRGECAFPRGNRIHAVSLTPLAMKDRPCGGESVRLGFHVRGLRVLHVGGHLLMVDYTGRFFREGKVSITGEWGSTFDRLRSGDQPRAARGAKELVARFTGTTGPRLRRRARLRGALAFRRLPG